jgi:hypothetical protein
VQRQADRRNKGGLGCTATRHNIWSNRYTPTGGWGVAELIETDNAGNAEGSQVAIDPSGSALAVWEQLDDTRENIWSSRFE